MLVYKITNIVNNKLYIGVTVRTLHNRWIRHKSSATTGSMSPIHRAIRKYGDDKFIIEELCTVNTITELKDKECELIALFKTYGNPTVGYNATRGGDGTWGRMHSIITRQRIRIGQAIARAEGRWLGESHLVNIRKAREKQINVPLSKDHRANISKALKGRKKNEGAGKPMRPVIQSTKDGVIIIQYVSISAAARAMNTDSSTIMKCCQGKYKTVRGFIFTFKDSQIGIE